MFLPFSVPLTITTLSLLPLRANLYKIQVPEAEAHSGQPKLWEVGRTRWVCVAHVNANCFDELKGDNLCTDDNCD